MDNPPPAATSGLTPYLTIKGAGGEAAIAFYRQAFGAEVRHLVPAQDGKRIMHAHLLINGCSMMISDDFPEFHEGGRPAADPGGFTLHLSVDDADGWWKRAVDAGAQVTMPLDDQFWGDRYGQLKDPFGFSWSISAPVKK